MALLVSLLALSALLVLVPMLLLFHYDYLAYEDLIPFSIMPIAICILIIYLVLGVFGS